jgi:DNA-binding transcriptional ArsR family regulator
MTAATTLLSKRSARSEREQDGLFKALADSSRRKILGLLAQRELPLHQIEASFKMSRPAVIKHVRILKSCGLVRVRKDGRRTIHALNAQPLRTIKDWMATYEAFWDERLLKLKQQVEGER